MTQLSTGEVAGEHALREGERDRLGFGEVAERIANSIVDRASIDGLVIGKRASRSKDSRWSLMIYPQPSDAHTLTGKVFKVSLKACDWRGG